MRIALNLLHAHPAIGGGWNYIANVVNALGRCDDRNQYICYCTAASACLVPNRFNFCSRPLALDPLSRLRRVLYENTLLQWRSYVDRIDVMHWFGNSRALFCHAPSVVTVHDLIAYTHPESYQALNRWYTRRMLSYTSARASVITPVSETTAVGLSRRFRVGIDRLVVVKNPLGYEFTPHDHGLDEFRKERALPTNFWLYVAHFYEHKNHRRLLEAYRLLRLRRPDAWPLVLRGDSKGADAVVTQLIHDYGLTNAVLRLPALRPAEMPLLYSSASGLIFPSLAEGGGIPVMEAMACGCPVLASDIPVMREVTGAAADFFDPTRVDAIADAMERFSHDEPRRAECRARGLAQVAEQRPEQTHKRLQSAYTLAIDRRHRSKHCIDVDLNAHRNS